MRAHAATACTPWRQGWRALSHRTRTENGRMADELAHRTQKGYGRPRVPLALRSRAPTRLTRALACAAMALADGVYAPAAGVAGLVAPRARREWEDGGGACASHSYRVLPPSRPPGAALARTDASNSVRATALAPSVGYNNEHSIAQCPHSACACARGRGDAPHCARGATQRPRRTQARTAQRCARARESLQRADVRRVGKEEPYSGNFSVIGLGVGTPRGRRAAAPSRRHQKKVWPASRYQLPGGNGKCSKLHLRL